MCEFGESIMNRRAFLRLAGASALSSASILSGCAPSVDRTVTSSTLPGDTAQFSLRIAPIKLEISSNQIIQTIGYNGSAPGPLLRVKEGQHHRITMENRSGDDHLIPFHRDTFEITRIGGKTTSGILKDTINVPRRQSVEIDFVADDPGFTLYHCHMQLHIDFGFMALMKFT
jgi:FtsP/CotA-like multicopper oxidase with cupredoxin domain